MPPTLPNSEDRGGMKMPYDFLFTFVTFSKQIAGLEKKSYSLEWPAYQDERVERPNIYLSWTVTKLGPQTCFVNKQLTDVNKKLSSSWFLTWFWTGWLIWYRSYYIYRKILILTLILLDSYQNCPSSQHYCRYLNNLQCYHRDLKFLNSQIYLSIRESFSMRVICTICFICNINLSSVFFHI